jgi:hypothetical protein
MSLRTPIHHLPHICPLPPPHTHRLPHTPTTTPRASLFSAGTWQHDLAQAALVERHPNVSLKAYGHDDHRLALALARAGKLAPLLREAVSHLGGVPGSRNVRLVNML